MESSDITGDNNNTLDKSKNGNMSPEPDTNTLYSNGETLHNGKSRGTRRTFILGAK